MKRIMFIGRSGCGKTSLTQALYGQDLTYKKTQTVTFSDFVVDTPGEFTENRRFFSALMVSAVRADIIGFVQDAGSKISIFPPKFAGMFKKEVIGIISKVDLDNVETDRSRKFLERAGASNILETSAVDGTGIQTLLNLLM